MYKKLSFACVVTSIVVGSAMPGQAKDTGYHVGCLMSGALGHNYCPEYRGRPLPWEFGKVNPGYVPDYNFDSPFVDPGFNGPTVPFRGGGGGAPFGFDMSPRIELIEDDFLY